MTITLRKQPLKNGRLGLYLDYYEAGLRYKKGLGLYLYNHPTTKEQVEHNQMVNYLAHRIVTEEYRSMVTGQPSKAVRLFDVFKREYGVSTLKKFSKLIKRWNNPYLFDITNEMLEEYAQILKSYKSAKKLWQLFSNLMKKYGVDVPYKSFQSVDVKREYATIEELQKIKQLKDLPAPIEMIKNLALFSAYTGLRLGDIASLNPTDIVRENGGLYIKKLQNKTKRWVIIPINEEVLSFIAPYFKELKKLESKTTQRYMIEICKRAGIEYKRFHSMRRTYATLLVNSGVDIYTVSKLLGHTDVETTQKYIVNLEMEKRVKAFEVLLKKIKGGDNLV